MAARAGYRQRGVIGVVAGMALAALLLLVEPVLNPLFAWAVHGERPGIFTLAGGAVILGATALEAVIPSRDRASPPP